MLRRTLRDRFDADINPANRVGQTSVVARVRTRSQVFQMSYEIAHDD